jgi:phosphopantetheine--protein transferase-like protein
MIRAFLCRISEGDFGRYLPFLSVYRQNRIARSSSKAFAGEQIIGELFLLFSLDKIGAEHRVPLEIKIGGLGKPELVGCPYRYNLSHSQNCFGTVLHTAEVGIDLERLDRKIKFAGRKILTEAESEEYQNSDDADRFLLKTWVKKEAVLKYLGLGLAAPLNKADVSGLNAIYENERIKLKEMIFGQFYAVIAAKDAAQASISEIEESEFLAFVRRLEKGAISG